MIRSFFIVALILLAACKSGDKEESSNASRTSPSVPVKNDLPSLQIRLVDGNVVDLKSVKGKTTLVLFQPDCDHCQHEAIEIKENIERFDGQTMYFISSSPVEQIVKFSKDYGLAGRKNILFGATTTENILNTFGPIAAPSIYIYSENGSLIKQFNGQTPVAEIVKYL